MFSLFSPQRRYGDFLAVLPKHVVKRKLLDYAFSLAYVLRSKNYAKHIFATNVAWCDNSIARSTGCVCRFSELDVSGVHPRVQNPYPLRKSRDVLWMSPINSYYRPFSVVIGR